MGEVPEARHIHPAYHCRAEPGAGLAHMGTLRMFLRCSFCRGCVSITGLDTHFTQKRDAGVVGLGVSMGLGIRNPALLF